MDDMSDLMSAVENHIIDALSGLDDILYLFDPQTAEAKQDKAELEYFAEMLEKIYARAKSTMNEIEG